MNDLKTLIEGNVSTKVEELSLQITKEQSEVDQLTRDMEADNALFVEIANQSAKKIKQNGG